MTWISTNFLDFCSLDGCGSFREALALAGWVPYLLGVGLGSGAGRSHSLLCSIRKLQLAFCPQLSLASLSPDSLAYTLQRLSWLLLRRLWGDPWRPPGVATKYSLNTDFQQIPIFNPIPHSIFYCVFNTWGFLRFCDTRAYFLSGIPSGYFGFDFLHSSVTVLTPLLPFSGLLGRHADISGWWTRGPSRHFAQELLMSLQGQCGG